MNLETLIYDIETYPINALVWGLFETDVFHMIEPGYLLCISYKWLGEKEIHTISLRDFKGYKGGSSKEKELTAAIWKLFDRADILVGQNSDSFDEKEINARFIKYGFPPPSPYKRIDTYKMSKKIARLPSHKLTEKGKYFGYGEKLTHTGKKLWIGCGMGDDKSWTLMEKYNRVDVELTEADYRLFAPWVKLPNVNLYTDGVGCPKPGCGGKVRRSHKNVRDVSSLYNRYVCKLCGGWCRDAGERMDRIEIRP